jgi:hypothetical protein
MAGKGWHKTTILLKKATRKCRLFCLHYIKTCKKILVGDKICCLKNRAGKGNAFPLFLSDTVFSYRQRRWHD